MNAKLPEIQTGNGKATVVVHDTETHEKMAELAQYAESLQSIRRAMSEQGRTLEEFTAKFEAERDIRR